MRIKRGDLLAERISIRRFNERRSGDALLNISKQSRLQALIV